MAAEQRKLLEQLMGGTPYHSNPVLLSSYACLESHDLELTYISLYSGPTYWYWSTGTQCAALYHRPESLPFLPCRHLPARPLHEHQAGPRTMPQGAQRRLEDGVRDSFSSRKGEMGIRVRLYARHAEVH